MPDTRRRSACRSSRFGAGSCSVPGSRSRFAVPGSWSALIVCRGCGGTTSAPESAPYTGDVLVLRNFTLIDGTGRAPVANAAMVVEGGRVSWVGPAGDLRHPRARRRRISPAPTSCRAHQRARPRRQHGGLHAGQEVPYGRERPEGSAHLRVVRCDDGAQYGDRSGHDLRRPRRAARRRVPRWHASTPPVRG